MSDRGCIFFNFGSSCVVRLFVAIHSLRQFYSGPIACVLFDNPEFPKDFDAALSKLKVQKLSASAPTLRAGTLRHRVLQASPYGSTLAFDSDLVFRAEIDPLWNELETTGLLVTPMKAYPYGIQYSSDSGKTIYEPGSMEQPGTRMQLLRAYQPTLSDTEYAWAVEALVNRGFDVNVGVMGIAGKTGEAFLTDYERRMDRCRLDLPNQDEFIIFGMCATHPFTVADISWNFGSHPAYWTGPLEEAKIVHYFADGVSIAPDIFGRDPLSPTGMLWTSAYELASSDLPLHIWECFDPYFEA